jgi:PAS domain S-box-containing protein
MSKVLLATRDVQLSHSVEPLLKSWRYQTVTCDQAEELVALVAQEAPQLVIMDDDLTPAPDQAYALCAELRTQPSMEYTPLIMLVSDECDDVIESVLQQGATDYLVKPVRAVILRQRIRYFLQMVEMQHDLRQSEEKYRIISNMISDYAYAYGVNPDGSLVKEWSTKAFETITGYDPNELDGNGWSQLIHPDDRDITLQRYVRLISGEKDVSEFRIITKGGAVRWLLDHGQPVFDEVNGRVIRIYGAAQDITERKLAEQMLRAQTAELQERNQELDAFAHTVAHDLKNPISSMMGFASLVLNYFDRMTDDKVKEYLALIMESGYKLKDIINSLLLLASVNKLDKVELKPLDMAEIVRQSQRRMWQIIQEHQAEIIEPPCYPTAIGYAPWVEEVWANYLSNALKYGGNPPRIEFGADDPQNGFVRFWIIDNGQGLTEDEQRQIFTPFTRLSQAKIEGHGLGLSVVHRIVSKLGGEVGVQSAPDGGCKFSFTLPTPQRA